MAVAQRIDVIFLFYEYKILLCGGRSDVIQFGQVEHREVEN